MFSGFSPGTLTFFRQLQRNNNRDWFNANKETYLRDVLDPALELVEAMQPVLEKYSPCFQAVPKRSGGSVMRIYRDTRFSKDKTPYKTNLGIQFRHQAGKDVHAPGYYFHLAPDEIFFGVGIWKPANPVLHQIRDAIVEDPQRWLRLWKPKSFRETFRPVGDTLLRPPRGFDPDHPLIEDLKRKDHLVLTDLHSEQVLEAGLVKQLAGFIRTTRPWMQFLCDAQGLPC